MLPFMIAAALLSAVPWKTEENEWADALGLWAIFSVGLGLLLRLVIR